MSSGDHRTVYARAVLTATLLAGAALATGCSSGGPASTTTSTSAVASSPAPSAPGPAAAVVRVEERKFSPTAITIKVGDTVTWKFSDKVPHAVQGIGDVAMGIDSPIVNQGEWSHTFTIAGRYRYLCPLHPEMRGTVTVTG